MRVSSCARLPPELRCAPCSCTAIRSDKCGRRSCSRGLQPCSSFCAAACLRRRPCRRRHPNRALTMTTVPRVGRCREHPQAGASDSFGARKDRQEDQRARRASRESQPAYRRRNCTRCARNFEWPPRRALEGSAPPRRLVGAVAADSYHTCSPPRRTGPVRLAQDKTAAATPGARARARPVGSVGGLCASMSCRPSCVLSSLSSRVGQKR